MGTSFKISERFRGMFLMTLCKKRIEKHMQLFNELNKSGDACPEKDIQSAILKMWKQSMVSGSLVAAIPNQRAFGQSGLTKGLPDLILIANGAHMYLELKRGKGFWNGKKVSAGTLSNEQKAFAEICNANNIKWSVSYGLSDAIEQCRAFGVIR